MMEYPIVIVPLSEEDGGGFAGYVVDLPGCMSDGDTPAEALRNTMKAAKEWVAVYGEIGRKVPKPGSAAAAVQKERESLRARLAEAVEAFDSLDVRVEELARAIQDIQERLDNTDAWLRFERLTGVGGTGAREPKEHRC